MFIIAYCAMALGVILVAFGFRLLRRFCVSKSANRERLIRRDRWTYILGIVLFVSGLMSGLVGLSLLFIFL